MSAEHPEAESVELYALGALSDQERTAFERHLGDCRQCQIAVAAANGVMAAMAATAPRAPLPTGAERRLRAALAREADAVPARARPRKWPAWGAGVAGGLAVALCAGVALLWQSHAWQARLTRAEGAQSTIAANADAALAGVGRGVETRVVAMAGTAAAPAASARAVLVQGSSGGLLLLTASGLPVPTGTEVYQLWLINGNRHTSAGVLSVTRTGQGLLSAKLRPGVTVQALGITAEPRGPAPRPYGVKVLGGAVASGG